MEDRTYCGLVVDEKCYTSESLAVIYAMLVKAAARQRKSKLWEEVYEVVYEPEN